MFIKFMHVPLESIKTNPRSEFDVRLQSSWFIYRDEFYLFRVVVRWQGGVITLLDLLAQGEEIHLVSIKRTLQGCHLEKKIHTQIIILQSLKDSYVIFQYTEEYPSLLRTVDIPGTRCLTWSCIHSHGSSLVTCSRASPLRPRQQPRNRTIILQKKSNTSQYKSLMSVVLHCSTSVHRNRQWT